MTLSQVYARCYRDHWNTERFQASGWAKEVQALWTNHVLPVFGDKDVRRVRPKQVRTWHRSLQQIPTTANRCLEVLSRVFAYAEQEELIPLGFNPCRAVKAFPERKRSRYATEEELARIGSALYRLSGGQPVQAAYCIALALTGARPRSLQEVRREKLQLFGNYGILRFHGKATSDSGREEEIVLTGEALELVGKLPHRDDGLLFGPVVYRRFWERVLREAGCKDLWLRDLRRTYASVGFSAGVPIGPIGELLNHSSTETTKGYAKLMSVARRDAAVLITDRIAGILKR